MKVNLDVMFLGYKVGTNDDGDAYYQGQFLEKDTNQSFRMYFDDFNTLKDLVPYDDYTIECQLYLNNKGLWVLRGV